MSSFDLISMAIRNLWKRKLRTFLTVLGVIIGTASIVVMVSLGLGMSKSFEDEIAQMGNIRVIEVYNYNQGGYVMMDSTGVVSKSKSEKSEKPVLDENVIETIRNMEGVQDASPILELYLYFLVDKKLASLNVRGIEPRMLSSLGYELSQGRLLNDTDTLQMVFGSTVNTRFFNPNSRDPWAEQSTVDLMNSKIKMSYDYNLGRKTASNSNTPKVKPYIVEAVGILGGSNYEVSYNSYITLTQALEIQKEQKKNEQSQNQNSGGGSGGSANKTKEDDGYEYAMVLCDNTEAVQAVQKQIQDMGFSTYSLSDALESMNQISGSIQLLLGAIGAVSLFVAAIGITNTMVMSIYERTREIGVMKVIGAALKDIKRLFLTEAALIGFLGGVFGLVISMLLSNVINYYAAMSSGTSSISYIPIWLNLLSLGFSTMVGVVSGYFPAKRAMKLSALSAIRTE